jgi:hypothetical protein
MGARLSCILSEHVKLLPSKSRIVSPKGHISLTWASKVNLMITLDFGGGSVSLSWTGALLNFCQRRVVA